MPSAEASGAICVQRFDGSRNSAIHTTYRISLRSSSLREPRYPLLRVVFVRRLATRAKPDCFSILISVKENRPTWLPCIAAKQPTLPATIAQWARNRHACHPVKGNNGPTCRCTRWIRWKFNDPSAGSPTETLLRLLLPLDGRV